MKPLRNAPYRTYKMEKKEREKKQHQEKKEQGNFDNFFYTERKYGCNQANHRHRAQLTFDCILHVNQ